MIPFNLKLEGLQNPNYSKFQSYISPVDNPIQDCFTYSFPPSQLFYVSYQKIFLNSLFCPPPKSCLIQESYRPIFFKGKAELPFPPKENPMRNLIQKTGNRILNGGPRIPTRVPVFAVFQSSPTSSHFQAQMNSPYEKVSGSLGLVLVLGIQFLHHYPRFPPRSWAADYLDT